MRWVFRSRQVFYFHGVFVAAASKDSNCTLILIKNIEIIFSIHLHIASACLASLLIKENTSPKAQTIGRCLARAQDLVAAWLGRACLGPGRPVTLIPYKN